MFRTFPERISVSNLLNINKEINSISNYRYHAKRLSLILEELQLQQACYRFPFLFTEDIFPSNLDAYVRKTFTSHV